MKENIYWAGVWFAFGLGIVLWFALTPGMSWGEQFSFFLFVVVAALGSWLTGGIVVGALLLMILENLGVL